MGENYILGQLVLWFYEMLKILVITKV